MTRREFPRSVRVAVIKRCTRDGVVYCEGCGLPARRFQIDHINPDGLTGEPVLANAQLICEACFGVKNPQDAKAIAKAKRREAAHIGAKPAPRVKIKSRGFAKRARSHAERPALPRRAIYE